MSFCLYNTNEVYNFLKHKFELPVLEKWAETHNLYFNNNSYIWNYDVLLPKFLAQFRKRLAQFYLREQRRRKKNAVLPGVIALLIKIFENRRFLLREDFFVQL